MFWIYFYKFFVLNSDNWNSIIYKNLQSVRLPTIKRIKGKCFALEIAIITTSTSVLLIAVNKKPT